MNQHYDLGYICAIDGGRVDDNPYHYDCLEQASWEQGFFDGEGRLISEDNNNDGFGGMWNEIGDFCDK